MYILFRCFLSPKIWSHSEMARQQSQQQTKELNRQVDSAKHIKSEIWDHPGFTAVSNSLGPQAVSTADWAVERSRLHKPNMETGGQRRERERMLRTKLCRWTASGSVSVLCKYKYSHDLGRNERSLERVFYHSILFSVSFWFSKVEQKKLSSQAPLFLATLPTL